MTAADYRRAAAKVRKFGKATGTYRDYRNRVCTIGAMGAAMALDVYQGLCKVTDEDIARVSTLIGDVPGERVSICDILNGEKAKVIQWSDLPDTTAEDIALVLEQCAEKLEASEVISST
jgi:hypothetical protein